MEEIPVYKKSDPQKTLSLELFLCGKLDPANRWVRLAHLIPWNELEELSKYKNNFRKNGKVAKSFRIAFGTLLIQSKLNLTDEETSLQIAENPYLQYFLGFKTYQPRAPFNPSLMVHFRKRLTADIMNDLNLKIMELQRPKEAPETRSTPETPGKRESGKALENAEENEPVPQGELILDATCAPADIAYPTDLRLLNHAREQLERIIDYICERLEGLAPKPRTHP